MIRVAGENFFNQLGQPSSSAAQAVSRSTAFVEVDLPALAPCADHEPTAIQQITCSALGTAVLMTDGSLYHWGCLFQRIEPVPKRFVFSSRIVQIACGRKHCLALSESSQVYSWGSGALGRLGHGNTEALFVPKVITSLLVVPRRGDSIVSVGCGGAHSGCITSRSEVFAWGWNRYLQCGEPRCNYRPLPQPVDTSSTKRLVLSSFTAGRHHSAVLSSCGQLFTWGANTTSRLGLPHIKAPVVNAPTHVDFFRDHGISRVVCGDFHMAALVDGVVFTWGLSFDGQTGLGKRFCVRTPTALTCLQAYPRPVIDIAAGSSHTLAIMSDGAVFIWGAGDGGLGVVSGFAATVDPPLNPGFDAHGVAVATAELATCPIPALLRIPSDHSVIAAAAGSCHTVLHVVPVRPDPPDLDSLDHSGWFDPVKDQLMRAEAPFAEAALPCQEEIDEVFSCCRFNRPKTLASILEGDFRVDVRDALLNTPLIVAAQSNQRVIAQMLLDAGANPNAQNAEGQTALHYCFKYEFSQLANTLIAYGADDTLPNKFMLTPYEGLTLSDLDDF